MEIHLRISLQPLLMPIWYVMDITFDHDVIKYNCIQYGDVCKRIEPSSTITVSDSNDVLCSTRVHFIFKLNP